MYEYLYAFGPYDMTNLIINSHNVSENKKHSDPPSARHDDTWFSEGFLEEL